MAIEESRRAKSLFVERYGEEDSEPQSRHTASGVAEVPLKLTDERFAAEATRLQDVDLRTAPDAKAADLILEPAPEGQAADLSTLERARTETERAPRISTSLPRNEPGTAVREPSQTPASNTRDPRAGVISHSHQKLHRTFLDADLNATHTIDPRKPVPPAIEARRAQPAAARRQGAGLRAAVAFLVLLLVGVIGYGDLAMRQNHISAQQLPGARTVASALRGPVGNGLRRAGTTLEAAGDRTSEFLAKCATRFDNWRKNR